MAFLDYTGLSYFYDKLKLVFAYKSHTHVGSEITLTGYTKASSTSAVAATDTVNEAFGKVQKTLDGKQATLTNMTSSELTTGTATTARSISAKVIADYVAGKVSDLVDSAPGTLDTLKELADALGNDANFASTISTQIGSKLDASSANYIKALSISGTTITYTKGDNTTGTLTTQDNNTHNTAYLYAGASNGSANAETTNNNTYLILKDGSSVSNRVKVTGSGSVTVVSNSSGTITISGTNTTYDTITTAQIDALFV